MKKHLLGDVFERFLTDWLLRDGRNGWHYGISFAI